MMNQNLQRRRISHCVHAMLLVSAPLLATLAAHGATITVDSAADADPSVVDGSCTLREAIAAADSNAAFDSCPAGSSSEVDTIRFGALLAGSIITVANDLHFEASQTAILTGDIGNDGSGNITLSGGDVERVIRIDTGATVTLRHLTLTNGHAPGAAGSADYGDFGGAIYNGGTLTLEHVEVRDSYAKYGGAGIFNRAGELTVSHSTVTGNISYLLFAGGGIRNRQGQVTVVESTLSGNSASNGGAIANENDGTVTVSHSIVSGNDAGSGSGISNYDSVLYVSNSSISGNTAGSWGGGIENDFGTVTISQSTVNDNTAAQFGGGLANQGTAIIVNSTFAGNSVTDASGFGGAIRTQENSESGSTEISHSTIAGNTAAQAGGIYIDNLETVTVTGSIVAGNSGGNCGGVGTFSTTDSLSWPLVDTSCPGATQADPVLGPLADNGGPTQTMLPGSGSAAIDAIACDPGVMVDQRGVARPQGTQCDIGAVEVLSDLIFANGFD